MSTIWLPQRSPFEQPPKRNSNLYIFQCFKLDNLSLNKPGYSKVSGPFSSSSLTFYSFSQQKNWNFLLNCQIDRCQSFQFQSGSSKKFRLRQIILSCVEKFQTLEGKITFQNMFFERNFFSPSVFHVNFLVSCSDFAWCSFKAIIISLGLSWIPKLTFPKSHISSPKNGYGKWGFLFLLSLLLFFWCLCLDELSFGWILCDMKWLSFAPPPSLVEFSGFNMESRENGSLPSRS